MAQPKGQTIQLRNEADINLAWDAICQAQKVGNWECVVQPRKPRDRSAEQNRLQFMWAKEVAFQCEDRSIEEIRHDWKLRHGVPILRRDNPEFQDFYDNALKARPFEEKVNAMAFVPISSLMSVKQMQEYLDTVQRESLQQGYRLTDPEAQGMETGTAETGTGSVYDSPVGKADAPKGGPHDT